MELLSFLRLSFKSEMIYKMNFIFNLVLIVLFQITRYFYIDSLFLYQSEFGSWSLTEATFAFLLSIALTFGIEAFASSIGSFCRKVYLGQLDSLLCKPLSPSFVFFFWGAKLSNLLLSFLVLILAVSYYVARVSTAFSALDYLMVVAVFVLLIAANVLVFALASLTIFWAHRVIPVSYIFNQLLKLNLVPGSIYKKNLFTLFVFLTPTIISSAIFVSVFAVKQYFLVLYLALSCIMLMSVFLYLFRKALRYSPVHGG
jgi:ABC-type uncharacterized transport system permease subunit